MFDLAACQFLAFVFAGDSRNCEDGEADRLKLEIVRVVRPPVPGGEVLETGIGETDAIIEKSRM